MGPKNKMTPKDTWNALREPAERDCPNCKHESLLTSDTPCNDCRLAYSDGSNPNGNILRWKWNQKK